MEDSLWSDRDYRIVGKLAFQPVESVMQEYDIDWLMPYDEDTGEVDDNELSIVSIHEIPMAVNWWLDSYNRAMALDESVAA